MIYYGGKNTRDKIYHILLTCQCSDVWRVNRQRIFLVQFLSEMNTEGRTGKEGSAMKKVRKISSRMKCWMVLWIDSIEIWCITSSRSFTMDEWNHWRRIWYQWRDGKCLSTIERWKKTLSVRFYLPLFYCIGIYSLDWSMYFLRMPFRELIQVKLNSEKKGFWGMCF